jgi:hypothetical protein
MTKFQIVTNGARKSERFDTFHPIECFAARGYEYHGEEQSTRLREELRGQPKFKGLAGPMWGGTDENGDAIIRYEDWQSYEILSR